MDPQINSSLFSYIFKRANIFSFIHFLTKIFTSQCFLRCVVSHQGDYSAFHFYNKSLKTLLKWDILVMPSSPLCMEFKNSPQSKLLYFCRNPSYDCSHLCRHRTPALWQTWNVSGHVKQDLCHKCSFEQGF